MLFFIFIFLFLGLIILNNNAVIISIITLLLIIIIYKKFKNFIPIYLTLFAFFIGVSTSVSLKYKGVENHQNGIFVVEKVSDNYFIASNYVNHFYIYEKNTKVDEGDFLKLEGNLTKINFITLESEYDFKNYLKTRGVEYQLYISSKETVISNFINPSQVKENFLNNYSDESQSLINSLLFSKTDYDSDLVKNSNSLNLISLISVSGIFINSFIRLLTFLFGIKLSEKKACILSFSLVVPYFLINIFDLSVLRICLINFGKILNTCFFKKRFSYLNIISFIGIILLILNPYNALSLSFLLGFGTSLTYILLLNFKNKKVVKNSITKGTLFTLYIIPVQLNFNKSFNLFSFIYQIVLLPLMNCVFIFCLVSFYIGYNPFLESICCIIIEIFKWLNTLKFVIHHDSFSLNLIIIYYFFYFLLIYLLEKQIFKLNKKVIVVYTSTVILALMPFKNLYEKSINFINVGQGDSILIRDKNISILIDTGGLTYKDLATSSLINYFKKKEIYKIDSIIITHDDFDHNGALESLLKYFSVGDVITEKEQFPYNIGNLKFENYNIYNFSDSNDSSLVLMLNFYNNKFLFMGDASKNVEEQIIKDFDVDADYIKIGHHGSKNSTSQEFIDAVSPKEAIISCGLNNNYGHPSQEVLDILEKENVIVRRTDLEGTISYYF